LSHFIPAKQKKSYLNSGYLEEAFEMPTDFYPITEESAQACPPFQSLLGRLDLDGYNPSLR